MKNFMIKFYKANGHHDAVLSEATTMQGASALAAKHAECQGPDEQYVRTEIIDMRKPDTTFAEERRADVAAYCQDLRECGHWDGE